MKVNFKNKTFWISLTCAIIIFLQQIGEIFGFKIDKDVVLNIVNALCGVLIVLGIITNPSKENTSKNATEQDNDNDK